MSTIPYAMQDSDLSNASSTVNGTVKDATRKVTDTLQEQYESIADQLRPQFEAVVEYAKAEPTKAMLIAAASGAGLMAVAAVALRGRGSKRLVDTSVLTAAVRELMAHLPQTTAHNAVEASKDRASSALDSLSQTWQNLRQQAVPMVDKLRPQLDAAVKVAKDDPLKTGMGAALAGAAIAGLVALMRHSET